MDADEDVAILYRLIGVRNDGSEVVLLDKTALLEAQQIFDAARRYITVRIERLSSTSIESIPD